MKSKSPAGLEPAFMSPADAGEYLALSQASVYRLLGLGKLKAVKAGGKTLVTVESLKALARSLPPAEFTAPIDRMGAKRDTEHPNEAA
jgi:excisionase family DNA binding protein